jgi:hypothetical protein
MTVSVIRFHASRSLFTALLLIALPSIASPLTIGLKGLATGWITGNIKTITEPFFGFRYIPELTLEDSLSQHLSLDFEMSLNAFGTAYIHSLKNTQTGGDIDLYRMWGRISSSRFEARIGLQKINFGSATLLRPLMWFDSIDPRDPLQLTNGVYGLLLRYYFLNNANIWIWSLYGFFPFQTQICRIWGTPPASSGQWGMGSDLPPQNNGSWTGPDRFDRDN